MRIDAAHENLDLADPVHVALMLLVVLLMVAILLVALTDIDTDMVSMGLVALMLSACLVVGTRGRAKQG